MTLTRLFPVLPALALLIACSGKKETTPDAATAPEKFPVEVSRVSATSVEQVGEYTATVEAFKTNNISSSTPNRIKSILVDVGAHVARGQKLVVLDNVNIDQLKINLDNIALELDRAKKLLEIGAGTRQSVDGLQAQYDAAARNYRNMQENTVLTAPMSGVVTARNYDPGDMTGALPILTVEQINPVKVVVGVSENDYSRISRSTPVTLTFDSWPGETFNGHIHLIEPTVDPATRTFKVEITIDNPGDKVLPGMFARVTLLLGTAVNVVVPDRAVVKMSGSGNKYVYVHSRGRVSYNRVTLGRRLGDSYEVIEGVADGDEVVVAGQSRLADGVEVEIINRKDSVK